MNDENVPDYSKFDAAMASAKEARDRHRVIPRVSYGRNKHCYCGSGKKFKKCCIREPADESRNGS
jgi:uncharacterized protein YecA (UPF0149 family)